MPKLPKFTSEEDLAEFVDTHDMAEYWDEMVPVDPGKFRFKGSTKTSVRVPLTAREADKLRRLAARRKVSLESLLHEWLMQRLKREKKVKEARA